MRKLILGLAMAAMAWQLATHAGLFSVGPAPSRPAATERGAAGAPQTADRTPRGSTRDTLADAFHQHRSGVQVRSDGVVTRVLEDDNDGSRHQRFIVRLASGQTILIAHNVDLAPRVAALREGDTVAFSGEYEWNEKGGVIHWTHGDPAGRHAAGWINHAGRLYR